MRIEHIHSGKTPRRTHYIAEWAAKRGRIQKDFVKNVGADKGTVSRWFAGALPETPYLLKIVAFLELEEIADLFRSPDDNWLTRMFEQRKRLMALLLEREPEELTKIKNMIEAVYPLKKDGTNG